MVHKRVHRSSPSTRAASAVLAMTTTTVLAAVLVLPSVAAVVEDRPGPLLERDDLHTSLPMRPRPRRLTSWGSTSKKKKSKSKKSSKSKSGSKCKKGSVQTTDDICDIPSSKSKSKSKSTTVMAEYIMELAITCDVTDDVIEGELTDALAESFGCVYNALACDKKKSQFYSQFDLDSVDVDIDEGSSNCEVNTTTTTTQLLGRRELGRRKTRDAYVSAQVGSGSCSLPCEDPLLVDDGTNSRRVLLRELNGCQDDDRCESLPARSDFETEALSRVRQTTGIGVYSAEFETDVCELESPGAPDPDSETTYGNKPWIFTVEIDCDVDVDDFTTQLGCALERSYNDQACNDRDNEEFYSQILLTGITVLREDDATCVRRALLQEDGNQGERKLGRSSNRVVLDASAEVGSGPCDNSGTVCDDEGAPLFDEGMRRRRDLQANTDRCAMLPTKEEVEQEAINEVNTVNDIDAELITDDCTSTDGTYDYEFNFALRMECFELDDEENIEDLKQAFACIFVTEYNDEACNVTDTGMNFYSQLVGGVVTTWDIITDSCDAGQGDLFILGKVTGTTGLDSEYCENNSVCAVNGAIREEDLFAEPTTRCDDLPSRGAVQENILGAIEAIPIQFESIAFVSVGSIPTTPPPVPP